MQYADCIAIEYGPISSRLPSNLRWSGGGGFETSSRPGVTMRKTGFSLLRMSPPMGPSPLALAVIMCRTRPY